MSVVLVATQCVVKFDFYCQHRERRIASGLILSPFADTQHTHARRTHQRKIFEEIYKQSKRFICWPKCGARPAGDDGEGKYES